MPSFGAIISVLGAISAINVGLLLSPLPTKLGFYRHLGKMFPELVGLTPAFHHGIEWRYTFDEMYSKCSQIKGETGLVTGANSGVGYEVSKALAKCGAHVTMACRNPSKCATAAKKIRQDVGSTFDNNEIVITTMTMDTSSLKSVQSFAKDFLSKMNGRSLDMLYLNAGTNLSRDELILSDDGYELLFATNYLGHHLLYIMLEPLMRKSKMARVIQTSSSASFSSFPHKVATSLEQLNDPKFSNALKLYKQTKLAQILWSKHLTKLLENDSDTNGNIYVNSAHPGAVDTGIWEKLELKGNLLNLVDYLRANIMWTTEEGALTLLYLGVAVDQLAKNNVKGKYFHPQAQEIENPLAMDEKLQMDLWEFSNELVSKFV